MLVGALVLLGGLFAVLLTVLGGSSGRDIVIAVAILLGLFLVSVLAMWPFQRRRR